MQIELGMIVLGLGGHVYVGWLKKNIWQIRKDTVRNNQGQA